MHYQTISPVNYTTMQKMLILQDEQRSISLNPSVIYLICDAQSSEWFDGLVASFNRSKLYTRGCFRFERLVRGEQMSEALPKRIADAIGCSDILVRLIDSASGDYLYLTRERNDAAFGEQDILDIVDRVCDENAKNLEQHRALCPDEGQAESLSKLKKHFEIIRKKRRETKSKTPKTKADMIGQILHTKASITRNFQDNLIGDGVLYAEDCSIGEGALFCAHSFEPYRDRMRSIAAEMKKEGISRGELEMILHEVFGVYNVDYSNEIALGAVDGKYSGTLERDKYQRTTPAEKVDVYVEIKKIPAPGGRKRRAYGVEISYNGKSYPVYMGSVDVRMVYLVSLLCYKAGGRLCQYAYKEQERLDKPMRDWLNEAYNLIEPSKKISFSAWMSKFDIYGDRPINQGASNARKLVENALEAEGRGALYYTELISEIKYGTDSYYTFRIAPDHIRVTPELQVLVDSYARLRA